MEIFLSNAFRYLKGESDLPSLLPDRSSLDVAKQSRKVRLFCEGLEKFREILYVEESDEDGSPHGGDDVMHAVGEGKVDEGVVTSVGADTDPEEGGLVEAITEANTNQKPRIYVFSAGGETFQSSYATEESPPASPGSASTSSTMVDPSSRKVSPSDSMKEIDAGPIAVKDFAYSSCDGDDHVCDSVSVVDANAKLELLRQLEMAGKANMLQSVEKQKVRNQVLSADLVAAKANLRNAEARDEVAEIHAKPIDLSNAVLQHEMHDVKPELSHEKHDVQIKKIQSAEETIGKLPKEGSAQNDVGSTQQTGASAYDRMQITSDEPGKGIGEDEGRDRAQQEELTPLDGSKGECCIQRDVLSPIDEVEGVGNEGVQQHELPPNDKMDGQEYVQLDDLSPVHAGDVQDRNQGDEVLPSVEEDAQGFSEQGILSPMGENVESETSDLVALEDPDRQATNNQHAEVIGCDVLDNASEAMQADAHVGESQVEPKQKVDDIFSMSGTDSTTLSGIVKALDPQIQGDLMKKDAVENSYTSEAPKEVTALGINASMGGAGELAPQEDQGRGSSTNIASCSDEETEKNNHKDSQSDDEYIEFASSLLQESTLHSKAEIKHLSSNLQSETPIVPKDQIMGNPPSRRPSEFGCADSMHEAIDNDPPSTVKEPPPPAKEPTFEDDADGISDDELTPSKCNGHGFFEFPEAAGPATLWGILQSCQYENEVEKREDDRAVEMASVSEVAGPAILWGILQSSSQESVGGNQEGDRAAEQVSNSEAGPATLWGILESDHCDSEREDQNHAHKTAADNSVLAADRPAGMIRPFGIPTPFQGRLAPIPFASIIPRDVRIAKDTDDNKIDDEAVPRAPSNTPIPGTPIVQEQLNAADDTADDVRGQREDTPKAKGPNTKDDKSRPEASAVLSRASCETGGAKSSDSDAGEAETPPETLTNNKQGIVESVGETVEASASSAGMNVTGDDHGEKADHPTCDVASESCENTLLRGGDGHVPSGKTSVQLQKHSDNAPSSPLAMSSYRAEKSEVIPSMSRPSKATKTHNKRKFERKRAAGKAAQTAEEQQRPWEADGVDLPHARAQRQAEVDAKIGEKRLRLQEARMMGTWSMHGVNAGR